MNKLNSNYKIYLATILCIPQPLVRMDLDEQYDISDSSVSS